MSMHQGPRKTNPGHPLWQRVYRRPARQGPWLLLGNLQRTADPTNQVRATLLIRFSAVAEGVKDNFLAKDVVCQAVISPADPPLSLAGFEPGQLLDVVLASPVVGVISENAQQLRQCSHQRPAPF